MHRRHTHAGAGAFTLIELMIVIGILALLIGILLPSLSAAREAARRAKCGHNLKSVGLSLATYANNHNNLLPNVPFVAGNDWSNIGQQADVDATVTPNANRDNLRALFLLVKQDKAAPELFLCPSTDDTAMNAEEVDENYDWLSRDNISFSFQNLRGGGLSTNSSSATMPIMADRNPLLKVDQSVTSYSAMVPNDSIQPEWMREQGVAESACSPNHGGSGQMVLRLGGHVNFEGTPAAGLVINDIKDNIYTLHNGATWGAPMTSDLLNDPPYDGRDAWLVP
jgi:type II secretory pathway pseudopilin PulG